MLNGTIAIVRKQQGVLGKWIVVVPNQGTIWQGSDPHKGAIIAAKSLGRLIDCNREQSDVFDSKIKGL